MSINQNPYTQTNTYLPAVLKENKSGWIVEYYVIHPQSKELMRKKIKLTRIITRYSRLRDARAHAQQIVMSLNQKLANGWNPFFENEDARMFEKLSDVARLFIETKRKELRKNTMRSYESFVNQFIKWADTRFPDIYCSVFAQNHAIRYMDELFNKSTVGVTTYNNHVKLGRALFGWMKERCYTKQNPFEQIRVKPKQKKTRVIIPPNVRKSISEYLVSHNNLGFQLVCKLIYSSLIRPNEINQLQIQHLDLTRGCILIPGDIAKNHKVRMAALTQEIIDDFHKLKVDILPKDYYLFSSNLLPGKEQAGDARYRKEWDRVRKALKLPQEMQLYSFRDTGIFEMIKSGIDNLSVMHHADHHSLEMTTRYADHFDPNLAKIIYERAPKF